MENIMCVIDLASQTRGFEFVRVRKATLGPKD